MRKRNLFPAYYVGIYNIANLGGGGNKTSSYTLRVV